jgi:hypothetical protein
MNYLHGKVKNLPQNPREIFDYARTLAFHVRVDEKGTQKNPGVLQRMPSSLTYEKAFELIQRNGPHWTVYFRNVSQLAENEKDYWEFGGCNLKSNDYGEVYLWIYLTVEDAEEVFQRFNLTREFY